jgi:hypothetical protein
VRAIAAQKNAKIETQDRARSATSMKTPRIVFSSFLALVVLVAAFAVEKARCDSLDSEQQALERKYKGNKKILDAVGKAKELVT